jgi:hypothetical protein
VSGAEEPFVEQRPELNKLAKWSLICTAFLLFPIGLILGVAALVQIRKTREDGVPLALIAIVAGLLAPAAVGVAVLGDAKRWDPCSVTREMEGLPLLRLARMLEEKHHETHGRYGTLDEIGFEPKVPLDNYELRVEHHSEDRYRVLLVGKGPQDGDLLAVDESKKVKYVRDLCRMGRE